MLNKSIKDNSNLLEPIIKCIKKTALKEITRNEKSFWRTYIIYSILIYSKTKTEKIGKKIIIMHQPALLIMIFGIFLKNKSRNSSYC